MPRYIVTPWRSIDELKEVRARLFQEPASYSPITDLSSFEPEPALELPPLAEGDFDQTEYQQQARLWSWRRGGLNQIRTWKLRADNIPYAITCTALFIEAKEQHWRLNTHTEYTKAFNRLTSSSAKNKPSSVQIPLSPSHSDIDSSALHSAGSEGSSSQDAPRRFVVATAPSAGAVHTAYAMAIQRFVTGFCDSAQNAAVKLPMYAIASQLGFPSTWVELRHMIAHGLDDLPPVPRLEAIADDMLHWLFSNFWEKLDGTKAATANGSATPKKSTLPEGLTESELPAHIAHLLKNFRNTRLEQIRQQQGSIEKPGPKKRKLESGSKTDVVHTIPSEGGYNYESPYTPDSDSQSVNLLAQAFAEAASVYTPSGTLSAILDSLLSRKMMIPSNATLSSLDVAFNIWESTVRMLDRTYPSFSPSLIDRLTNSLIRADSVLGSASGQSLSVPSDDDGMPPDMSKCRAIVWWLVRLTGSGYGAVQGGGGGAYRPSPLADPLPLFRAIFKRALQNPGPWTSALALEALAARGPAAQGAGVYGTLLTAPPAGTAKKALSLQVEYFRLWRRSSLAPHIYAGPTDTLATEAAPRLEGCNLKKHVSADVGEARPWYVVTLQKLVLAERQQEEEEERTGKMMAEILRNGATSVQQLQQGPSELGLRDPFDPLEISSSARQTKNRTSSEPEDTDDDGSSVMSVGGPQKGPGLSKMDEPRGWQLCDSTISWGSIRFGENVSLI